LRTTSRCPRLVPVVVDPVGELLNTGGALGLQRRRALAHDLVDQRPHGRLASSAIAGPAIAADYRQV